MHKVCLKSSQEKLVALVENRSHVMKIIQSGGFNVERYKPDHIGLKCHIGAFLDILVLSTRILAVTNLQLWSVYPPNGGALLKTELPNEYKLQIFNHSCCHFLILHVATGVRL